MAGIFDAYAPVEAPSAPKPIAASIWDAYPAAPKAPADALRAPAGLVESVQAGVQGSVIGHAWRRNVPNLVLDPEHSKWWERLATGVTQVAMDLPIMIPAGAAGGAAGTAVAGPVGGILTGGAAMFAAPAAIRTSLVEAYKARDAQTPADWFSIVKEVAKATVHEGAIGAVTMGTGALARAGAAAVMGGSSQVATAVGLGTATMATRGGARAAGATDVAGQIAAMVAMPAAMEGRLPEAREFADAAAVILTLKAGHTVVDRALQTRTTKRVMDTYEKTGRTPIEQVGDAQADARVAEDITTSEVSRGTDGRIQMPTIQEALFRDAARLTELEEKAGGTIDRVITDDFGNEVTIPGRPREFLTDAERNERTALRARVTALEAMTKATEPTTPTEATYSPDQQVDAAGRATARLAELNAREGALNDLERAERVFLTNAPAEAIAKHFKIEPVAPSRVSAEQSAQRVHDDILRQLREVDQARRDSGLPPLGDEHAAAVAALVRVRVRTRAARLGKLPEEIYAERPLQIRDETAAEVAAAEAVIPAGAPTFIPPEVDLFGAPIAAPMVPRHLSEGIPVQQVPVTSLKLSMDVPQFKKDANEKGVVQPLGGDPDPRGWAVQVWERLNGDLEVISGRHRLELWQRKNLETIPVQVHREADGFTRDMAARLDAELNIRDEQGSIADYAQYFKDSAISKEAADERGLLARHKGKAGFAIARDGSPELLAAHRAGQLSDEAALAISTAAPGSERLQNLGMQMMNDGKSALMAVNMMKAMDMMAAERMAKGAQGDIFGFDDAAIREQLAMAKRATSIQRKIGEQISAVSGASRRPELAKKMGVDVQDPEGIQKRIVELKQEQDLWDNWPLHPELVAKLRAPEVTGREGDLKQGPKEERPKYEVTADGPVLRATDIHITDPFLDYTENGVKFHRHSILDVQGQVAGETMLGWRGDQVVELINIVTEPQLNQSGERVIRAILSHNEPGTTLNVLYIQPQARGFWEKMGAKLTTKGEYLNGTITRASYEAARGGLGDKLRARKGDAGLPSDIAGKDSRGTQGDVGETPGREDPNILKQEDFDLKPETPAELAARNREAVEQAERKIAVEEGRDPYKLTRQEKRAQKDLFNEQKELFQRERASYQIAEKLITTMQGADKSSVVHELWHDWIEEMKADATRPDAPASLKADWEIMRREYGIPAEGPIPRAAHELGARTGERYLMEGRAPSIELRPIFERFKQWLLEIYHTVTSLNVPDINPELRGMLDRMLATDAEIADARELGVPRAYVAEARATEAARIVQPIRDIKPGFAAEQASMEPYADAIPKGPGEAPDNSHINYAYINGPMDLKLAMQKMAEIDQANIQKQRGGTDGVKSWAEANAEQARYVNDILGGNEDTLRLLSPRDPNAPGPDVRLGLLKKLAVGAAKDSARLRDVVLEAGHDATVRQQLEYMGSIERSRMIQAEFLGERAGVARALNALKDVTEGTGEIASMLDAIGYGEAAAREAGTLYQEARTPAQEQAVLKAKLDEILLSYKGKTVLDIARLHKEIGTLKGTFKMAKELEKATTWEMLVEGWKSALLSGPVTHTTNLFGTGAFQALRAPVDALAAIIGTARGASPGMGESDRASMSEALARVTGMLGGIQDGMKVAYHTFKLDDPTGKTEAYRTAIPGRAGELIRIPLRMMGAEDAMVSTMYRRGEIATLAIRQAFDEGLNPATREFADRVSVLKDNPTPEMTVAADTAATRMTFNMPLGEKGVYLQLFVQKWNLQWMIPFIRTPINIAKEVARMSPFAPLVGEWRADIAKGGVARDRALAEIALGSAIMAATMAYTFSGDISGGGSPDPGKNRGKAGVEQPYSWKIGDTWYEYARIQPTGTLMGMASDIAIAWDHMNDEEKDKVPKLLARAFANAVTNQTFLQGITNVIRAMDDPTRFGPKFVQQFAASMVPNIIGQPTAMADPVVREVNGMLEAVMARLPGFRQQLTPKPDWLGKPIETKERLGVIGPVRTMKVSDDKVRLEAARLDISMAAAPKKTHLGKGTGKLGDVELTPEERNKFAKVGGEMAHRILASVVTQPGYDGLHDLIKRKIFARILTASHQVAAVQALPLDKRASYLQSISEKVAAELAPAEQ